jgi:hypothetical protein
MTEVSCPSCGEEERLRGRPGEQEVVVLECEVCGVSWDRDARPRCRLCGSDDLRYAPEPLWERGRGEQRTPAGRRDAYDCYACGGRDVTSSDPQPG